MTSRPSSATAHWALLIGINFYVEEICLEGCVRDVETTRQYLEAGPTPVNIKMLTATKPSDPSSRLPIEAPDSRPTDKNLIAELKRIQGQAKEGDTVYIHYSGHGTRIPVSGERCCESGNLAFALLEENGRGCAYFRGYMLAGCLRKMVDQGLLVTLVLDCCYSGSVHRTGSIQDIGIRTIDYNPAVDSVSLEELPPGVCHPGNGFRDARMTDQWLIDPEGYTILAACGPHERSWELKVESGVRRGALSYFLIEALNVLRNSGAELTHQSLYEHLRMRFHASWPQQTPMQYGKQNFAFFGNLGLLSNTTFVSVYRRADDGPLCLSAGEAHGVHEGDEYAVYPFETSKNVSSYSEPRLKVRIKDVGCLTSTLVGIESVSIAEQIKTGWIAKPVNFSRQKTRVRLMEGVSFQSGWKESAEKHHLLHLCAENDVEACVFNVILNEQSEYEILDGALNKIASLPTIPADIPRAPGIVMDVLQHLTTSTYFEGIENRSPSRSFEALFSLLPLHGSRPAFEVKDGGKWGFTIENFDDEPLYLALFNFTPSWKVFNPISAAGQGDFLVVQPRADGENSKETVELEMEFPQFLQERGERECEDIIKVFVTSKPASFPSMVLPAIPPRWKDLYQQVCDGDSDQLSRLFSELTVTCCRSDRNDIREEEWATRNFIIRTTVD